MKLPTIKFIFDRKKTATPKKKAVVEMRITYDRKQYYLSTGVYLFKKQWDSRSECVKYSQESVELNSILSNEKLNVLKVFSSMADEGNVDIKRLIAKIKGAKTDISFVEYILSKTENNLLRPNTIASYKSFLSVYQKWGGMKFFGDVCEKEIMEFDMWLRGRKNLKTSTIWSYHKRLKHFIALAVVDGFLKVNPYVEKRISFDKGASEQVESLTEEQLSKIETLELPTSYLKRVRDLFLFQCYTGLAYIDMQSFDRDSFQPDENGVWFGKGHRVKTGGEFQIVLVKQARDILSKYDWHLPVITNQKYNQYLKVLGCMAGAPTLHSHMGRATFATVMLNRGVPLEVVRVMLGHKTLAQTQRYASMRESTIKSAMNGVFDE